MYSGRKGFLLPEMLISVLIVSLIAAVVLSSVRAHVSTAEVIGRKAGRGEEDLVSDMKEAAECARECGGEEPDISAGNSS